MAFLSNTRSSVALRQGPRASLIDLLSLHRQRRALASLDTCALQDIGVTHEDAQTEAKRGFWDVPAHWLK